MKLLIIALLTVSSLNVFAQAKKPATKAVAGFTREYGMAGCGLGSVVMGRSGSQLLAGTTNNVVGDQTFGITFGTSNCIDSASSEVAGRMDQFILVNRSQVQGDIARGQGETISALSTYMGCSSNIGPALKANYSTIFNGDVKANEITDSVISTILANPELAKTCNTLG